MTTMIEKLARAMALANDDYDGDALVWRPYVGDARACLTALLEPSEAMIDKGIDAIDYCVDTDWDSGGDGCSSNTFTTIRLDTAVVTFTTMIRAALEQKA